MPDGEPGKERLGTGQTPTVWSLWSLPLQTSMVDAAGRPLLPLVFATRLFRNGMPSVLNARRGRTITLAEVGDDNPPLCCHLEVTDAIRSS